MNSAFAAENSRFATNLFRLRPPQFLRIRLRQAQLGEKGLSTLCALLEFELRVRNLNEFAAENSRFVSKPTPSVLRNFSGFKVCESLKDIQFTEFTIPLALLFA